MDFPLDFKRGLKALWAQAAQSKKPSLGALERVAIKSPIRKNDPLIEVLAHLAMQHAGRLSPPLIPRIVPMPIAELCQLVLLWALAGEKEAASALGFSIPLDFPWMWCRENEYREEVTLASLVLLRKALGFSDETIEGGDPFFQVLAKNLADLPRSSQGSLLDWKLVSNEDLKCCLAFSGNRTSLGAIISDAADIRAFGPQTFPLSDSKGFGIREIAQHGNSWSSPAALPEVWFETKAYTEGKGIILDLSFFGLKPNSPLAFSFYARAESAQVGAEKLKPGTLHRYQGPSKPILFGDGLTIESLTPGKLETIPLAGGSGYWDCEFLAAFEIHPVNAKMTFFIY